MPSIFASAGSLNATNRVEPLISIRMASETLEPDAPVLNVGSDTEPVAVPSTNSEF
jgi:hypothetical protein